MQLDIDNQHKISFAGRHQRLRKVASGCFTRLFVASCGEKGHSADAIVESEKEVGERNVRLFRPGTFFDLLLNLQDRLQLAPFVDP